MIRLRAISRLVAQAALFCSLLSVAQGANDGFQIYPIDKIFITEGTKTEPNKLISDRWSDRSKKQLPTLGAKSAGAIRAAFGDQVTDSITAANKHRALVASVHIVRAEHFWIEKPGGNRDVYVPITGAIYFTNPTTGEVTLAVSYTAVAVQRLNKSDTEFDKKLDGLYDTSFDQLMKELVARARGRYAPTKIETKVVSKQLGYLIIDKGTDDGIGTGDFLIPAEGFGRLTAKFCQETRCSVEQTLGKTEVGGTLVKFGSGNIKTLGKPRAFVDVRSNYKYLDSIYSQIFAENIEAGSAFNIIFVNPEFTDVLRAVSEAQGNEISLDDISQRTPPDLIVSVRLNDPVIYYRPTNLSYKKISSVTERATARIVDPSGSVLFGISSQDVRDDEVVTDDDFALQTKRDIAIKNVLVDLASKVSTTFRIKSSKLELVKSGSDLQVTDSTNVISPKQNYLVYRSVKLQDNSTVAFPINKAVAEIDPERPSIVKITPGLGVAPEKGAQITERDFLLVNASASKGYLRPTAIPMCGVAENRGSISVQNIESFVFNATAEAVALRFVDQDAPESIESFRLGGSGFKSIKSAVDSVGSAKLIGDLCLNVIQRVEPENETCSKDNICQQAISAKFAIALKSSGEVVGQKIIGQSLRSAGYAGSMSIDDRRALIESTVEREADGLIADLLKLSKSVLEDYLRKQR